MNAKVKRKNRCNKCKSTEHNIQRCPKIAEAKKAWLGVTPLISRVGFVKYLK
jgi:hypothetical protein